MEFSVKRNIYFLAYRNKPWLRGSSKGWNTCFACQGYLSSCTLSGLTCKQVSSKSLQASLAMAQNKKKINCCHKFTFKAEECNPSCLLKNLLPSSFFSFAFDSTGLFLSKKLMLNKWWWGADLSLKNPTVLVHDWLRNDHLIRCQSCDLIRWEISKALLNIHLMLLRATNGDSN